MRYQDLAFYPHPTFSGPHLLQLMARLRREYPTLAQYFPDMKVEAAWVEFANGWRLSVLRNMLSMWCVHDWETCRFYNGKRGQPVQHDSIASVQAEIDAVAALAVLQTAETEKGPGFPQGQ